MDVTRRYVRNFSRWGNERARAPEPVLLYILNEIRALRRKDMPKADKFRIEGEEMRELRELQTYVATAIASEVCKVIPEQFYGPPGGPSQRRRDPDAQKAEEARQDAQRARAERTQGRGLNNGPGGAPSPHNPDQQPQR